MSPDACASLTGYDIRFSNRIQSVSFSLVTGIDYPEARDSVQLNVGGIRSRGVEAALACRVTPALTPSGNHGYNRATYLGTGNAAQDADVGVTPGRQIIRSPRTMRVAAARFVGDRFIGSDGDALAPRFTTVDAYAGVDPGQVDGGCGACRRACRRTTSAGRTAAVRSSARRAS